MSSRRHQPGHSLGPARVHTLSLSKPPFTDVPLASAGRYTSVVRFFFVSSGITSGQLTQTEVRCQFVSPMLFIVIPPPPPPLLLLCAAMGICLLLLVEQE